MFQCMVAFMLVGVCIGTSPIMETCADRLRFYNDMMKEPIAIRGLEKPACDENGDYLPMQCSGSQCYCVTPYGDMLEYSVNRWESDGMLCDCAIKEWEEQIEGVDSVVDCAPNGNYAK